jgi:hypothetical protein
MVEMAANLLLFFILFAGIDSGQLERMLAQWKPVKMPFDASTLNGRERLMVYKLVAASRCMESIYWRQSDPEGLKLLHTTTDPVLKKLLMINGSRYNLIDNNKPFATEEPYSPDHGLYPEGLTRDQIEQYVAQQPGEKDAIYSPYTVLRWNGGKLEAIPYHVEYAKFLSRAAGLLREAAALSDDPRFATFLKARADALLSDDYYPSDLLWVDLRNPKVDVIFAPYETYLDDILGVKTSYEAAVLIRNEAESARLTLYQKYVPDIQDALPLAKQDLPSKRGQPSPMEVVDAPFRTGDLRHGYQAVADNLPNDPRIHQAKGTKKIFFKNFMDARVDYVVIPLAKQVMAPEQAAEVSGAGYLAPVILHEISHGLGPAYARVNGKQIDIREAIGPIYSALEEAKADVVGMYGLDWLIEHGALPKARRDGYYASYVAGIFRTMRYGVAEAHGRAEMMEFNFLTEQQAIVRQNGRYAVDFARMPAALAAVSKELLEIEATGDRARAERWFQRYGAMPADVAAALGKVTGVPVDIDPIFTFPETVE